MMEPHLEVWIFLFAGDVDLSTVFGVFQMPPFVFLSFLFRIA